MIEPDLSDVTLILLGHGTALNASSSAPVFEHAAELRRRKYFAVVREAFWKQEPQLRQVLAEVHTERVVVVPLFISEGYFSDQVIPQALGFERAGERGVPRSRLREGRKLLYTLPVGTHPSMTNVILARAREVVEKFPFPRAPQWKDVTLFIAGHGTDQNDNSRQPVDQQVELLRNLDQFAGVHGVFLEEEPRIPACYAIATTRNLVVVPFFISEGLHVQEDIPVLLGEPERMVKQRLAAGQPTWRNPTEKHGKRLWLAKSVGTAACLTEVIVERAVEAMRQCS